MGQHLRTFVQNKLALCVDPVSSTMQKNELLIGLLFGELKE